MAHEPKGGALRNDTFITINNYNHRKMLKFVGPLSGCGQDACI